MQHQSTWINSKKKKLKQINLKTHICIHIQYIENIQIINRHIRWSSSPHNEIWCLKRICILFNNDDDDGVKLIILNSNWFL